MTSGVRIGFKPSQWGVDWPILLETWQLADELPDFDSGWLFDHFSGVREGAATPDGVHEAMTTAAALAIRTRRLRFGHLVLGNTHRHPALLARMATTIDHIAGPGRFVLGLGAGWLQADHRMFGWPLPPMSERMRMLESAVRIVKAMWAQPHGVSLSAEPYELHDARTIPPPLTRGGPPIWLGVQGSKGLGIVARYADGWNANGPIEEYARKYDILLRACEQAGRDPNEIEISGQVMCLGRSADQIRSAAASLADRGVGHLIFVISASEGTSALRRLASDIVAPLRDRYS